MKELLNEWRKFLNENEGERYYIRKMEPVSYEEAIDLIKDPRLKAVTQTQEDPGREYYKIEMSDGEILVGDYDQAEQDISRTARGIRWLDEFSSSSSGI